LNRSALARPWRAIRLLVTLVAAAALAATLPATSASAAGAPSDTARAQVRSMIENVTQADARRYQAADNTGRTMDSAKIIQDSTGGYLAVYHTMRADGRFHTSIATSTDLMNWTFVHDFGPGSSQPTIVQTSDGGYVMAWEQDPNNHVAVRYFAGRADLLAGNAARSFDAPDTLSGCAQGTPNIYSVTLSPDIDHSTIDIGGHYFDNCTVDREMRATLTDFTSWSATPQPNFDNALLYWGVQGNIGDRDAFTFGGYPFGVIEGQYTPGDFGSWRTFVYDYSTGNADTTSIRTDGGSTAFANPHLTVLRAPNGRPAVFVSLFLPSEGAAPGESGELLYYRTYAPTGPITGLAGKCVDDQYAGSADGTPVQLYGCNGTGAQQWTVAADGSLQVLGKCMDVTSGGTADGTPVQLWDCNGTGAQQWQMTAGGELVNPQSGKCLDVTGDNSADGTRLQIWDCYGTPNQTWTWPT
jgi:hypothetical protein